MFTDTGTTKRGERLYQFTHRTFLEYFTAAHLVRTLITTDQLMTVLIPRITNEEWEVVAQLAVQIQYTNVDNAGDEILEGLLRHTDSRSGLISRNCLLFAAHSLNYIVPSPRVCRQVVLASINEIVRFGVLRVRFGKPRGFSNLWKRDKNETDLLDCIIDAAQENRKVISMTIEKAFTEMSTNSDDKTIAIMIAIIDYLESFAYQLKNIEYANDLAQILWSYLEVRKTSLRKKWHYVALRDYHREDLALRQIIEWYGLNNIFVGSASPITDSGYISPADGILSALTQEWNVDRGTMDQALLDLEALGEIFAHLAFPFSIKIERETWRSLFSSLFGKENSVNPEYFLEIIIPPAAYFGAFILYALLFEQAQNIEATTPPTTLYTNSRAARMKYLDILREIMVARSQGVLQPPVEVLIKQSFGPEFSTFVFKWIRGEKRLLKIRNHSST